MFNRSEGTSMMFKHDVRCATNDPIPSACDCEISKPKITEHVVCVSESEIAKAHAAAQLYGIAYLVDGKYVNPERIMILKSAK